MATSLAVAHTNDVSQTPAIALREPAPASTGWFAGIWNFSLFRLFAPAFFAFPAAPVSPVVEPEAVLPPCYVAPLPTIDDPQAKEFESHVGSDGVVNRDGLNPRAAVALTRFEDLVASMGGEIEIKSAFRPAAYQEHLQEVWDKWMTELRNNQEVGCQPLRAQVQEEFQRHELLETQRPVPFSDHTRGIGIDASVWLPKRTAAKKRVPTVDVLARRVGLMRPAVVRDPVHFRLAGGRL